MIYHDTSDDLSATRRKLERLNRLYATLSRINRSIVRAEDPHLLYETTCHIAVEEGAFCFACAGLVDPSNRKIVVVARAGAPVDLERLLGEEAYSAGDRFPAVTAVLEERVCINSDLTANAQNSAWRTVLQEAGLQSIAAYPLWLEGRVFGVFMVASPDRAYFQDAEVRLFTEVAGDVSFAVDAMRKEEQRIAAETKIQYLAYYDSETGLPGRTLFTERVTDLCNIAEENAVIVMAIRLRRYHGALQVLGQAVGVHLARTVITRLEEVLPTAVIGRISESEFAVSMLIKAGDLPLVEEMASHIHSATAQVISVDGHEVFLEPRIGIAVYPENGSATDIIKAALTAAATDAVDSSTVYRFYVAELNHASSRRLDMEAALHRAIERSEFVLHYQPQVDFVTGRVVGAEALLRWQRPGVGLVPPVEFVPILGETGLIVPVGEWVLREACQQARRWQDEGLCPVRMAVNLSGRQFEEGDINAIVLQVLETFGLDSRWLELEITESIVLRDAAGIIRKMNEMKAYGVSYALDDFGTGYSSLSYLRKLPVSRIKIDKSFVANITTEPGDAAIVKAVVGMAHSLGLSVIAEGAETEGQLGFLCNLQCDEMQGFYFSRPLTADDFSALLQEKRCLDQRAHDQRSERILLLVDDEPNILHAVRRILRRSNFRLLTTTSITEGFDLLASHPVGVVICEQRMPEMTGTEFLRRVRQLHPSIVRVILSGYTELSSVIDAVNRGAVYKFLSKPWDEETLMQSLDDAFRLHEIERDNRQLTLQMQTILESKQEAH